MLLLFISVFQLLVFPICPNNILVIPGAGGGPAQPHQFPWMLSLEVNTDGKWYHICGASLISTGSGDSKSDIAITAAHCFDKCQLPELQKTYRIVAGMHLLSNGEGQAVDVSTARCADDYDPRIVSNDMAIIKLSSPLTFSSTVAPITLPMRGYTTNPGSECVLAGWGLIKEGKFTDELQYANLTIVEPEICSKFWQNPQDWPHPDWPAPKYDPRVQICAGRLRKSPDGDMYQTACAGDSGGPLTCHSENGTLILEGVTSYATDPLCVGRTISAPDVYTRVSAYVEWVEKAIREMK